MIMTMIILQSDQHPLIIPQDHHPMIRFQIKCARARMRTYAYVHARM